jgi:hypothetical protein
MKRDREKMFDLRSNASPSWKNHLFAYAGEQQAKGFARVSLFIHRIDDQAALPFPVDIQPHETVVITPVKG